MLLLHTTPKILRKPIDRGKLGLSTWTQDRQVYIIGSKRILKFFKRYNSHLSNECSDTSCGRTPKCLGPPTPVIVLRTSDGDAGDPPTLEVR